MPCPQANAGNHQAEEALGCYKRFTPSAAALAAQLGYRGLQWPKSVGPEGRSAPWIGNQVLLWNLLRQADADFELAGYGRLFAHELGGETYAARSE